MAPKPTAPAGYSGKALWQKLGLAAGQRVAIVDPPSDYGELTQFDVSSLIDADAELDLAHLFVRDRAALELALAHWPDQIRNGGMIWISWPKKSSSMFRDLRAGSPNGTEAGSREWLTEDGIRAVALPLGWVDVKVCAVDADWSGLKLLRRRR
jgi:hypothetical protein